MLCGHIIPKTILVVIMRNIPSEQNYLPLCAALYQLPASPNSFPFYPFTNEEGFVAVIQNLFQTIPQKASDLPVAILTGESNLVSLLPALAKRARIIICNDINPRINYHTQLLIDCLNDADNIEQFLASYQMECDHIGITKDDIDAQMFTMQQWMGPSYFLFDEQQFQRCKFAAESLSFVWTRINFAVPAEVQPLVDALTRYKAHPVFMNLSNIHHYCDCSVLMNNINLLTQGRDDCEIMFSCGITAKDKSLLRTRVDTKSNYFQLLTDTIDNAAIQADVIGIQARNNTHRFHLRCLVDKANQRTAEFAQTHLGVSKHQTPRIIMEEQRGSGGCRFFSLEKPRALMQNDKSYIAIAKQLLPPFAIKWFINQEDFTHHERISISYTFLLAFLDRTKHLEKGITQDDIRINRSGLPLFGMA